MPLNLPGARILMSGIFSPWLAGLHDLRVTLASCDY
jgi:hypothetical protein